MSAQAHSKCIEGKAKGIYSILHSTHGVCNAEWSAMTSDQSVFAVKGPTIHVYLHILLIWLSDDAYRPPYVLSHDLHVHVTVPDS